MDNDGKKPVLDEIPLPHPPASSTEPVVKSGPIKLIRTKLEQLKQKTSCQVSQTTHVKKPEKTRAIKIEHVFDTAVKTTVPDSIASSDEQKSVSANTKKLAKEFGASSSVVDELFKEFLANKLKAIENERKDSNVADGVGDADKERSGNTSEISKGSNGKKTGSSKLSLGLKISETSAALISSGQPVPDPNKVNLEDGELTDSEETESSDDLYGDLDDLNSETGSLPDDKSKKKKKKKHKHKSKKKKKNKDKDKSKEKDGKKSKEKSKERKKRSSSGHSRSRSPSKRRKHSSRSPSPSDSYFDRGLGIWRARSRSHSQDRHRRKSHVESEAERFWGKDYDRMRRRSRSRDNDRQRDRSRERDQHSYRDRPRRSPSREKIDKDRLRAIAVAKAYANMRAGHGPNVNLKPDEVACLRAGGRSIDELTKVCVQISEKQGDVSSSDESIHNPVGSEDEAPFMNHPFKVGQSSNIVMNIRNAKQLPLMTTQEKIAQSGKLRLEFPVSSGSQHRAKEDWVPVEKTKPVVSRPVGTDSKTPASAPTEDGKVFPDAPAAPIDIGAVVSERLKAVRKLQDNPNDVQAMGAVYNAQKKMNQWANSKNLPGQFVGSTGAQILSAQELSGLHPKNQAWFKKDQFQKAAPVKGGMGMFLLQKMGWKEGQGLGKNSEGPAEPLMLDFKIDRKGLTSVGEGKKKPPTVPMVKDLSGKHPVSALVEICNRRRWGAPDFILLHESGPDHKKNFLFKVKVNNTEYQPSVASANKKLAKAQAATVCLQALGMIPR